MIVDGLEYRESLQVVGVEGGIPGKHNVVPDSCTVTVGRRVAPSFTLDEAEAQVRELLDGADTVTVLQAQAGALPNLTNPLVAEFVSGLDLTARPKLGWTDVARFAARGVPAVNFGPGDPEVAHTAGEFVTRDSIERAYAALGAVPRRGLRFRAPAGVRADGAVTRPCRRSSPRRARRPSRSWSGSRAGARPCRGGAGTS